MEDLSLGDSDWGLDMAVWWPNDWLLRISKCVSSCETGRLPVSCVQGDSLPSPSVD
jgi:hypothetical protein